MLERFFGMFERLVVAVELIAVLLNKTEVSEVRGDTTRLDKPQDVEGGKVIDGPQAEAELLDRELMEEEYGDDLQGETEPVRGELAPIAGLSWDPRSEPVQGSYRDEDKKRAIVKVLEHMGLQLAKSASFVVKHQAILQAVEELKSEVDGSSVLGGDVDEFAKGLDELEGAQDNDPDDLLGDGGADALGDDQDLLGAEDNTPKMSWKEFSDKLMKVVNVIGAVPVKDIIEEYTAQRKVNEQVIPMSEYASITRALVAAEKAAGKSGKEKPPAGSQKTPTTVKELMALARKRVSEDKVLATAIQRAVIKWNGVVSDVPESDVPEAAAAIIALPAGEKK